MGVERRQKHLTCYHVTERGMSSLYILLILLAKPISAGVKLNYIHLRTKIPKPMPWNVAKEIPYIPTRISGTIKELHPLAVAIPHAVVGPPTFWHLTLKVRALGQIPSSFPNPRVTTSWTVT